MPKPNTFPTLLDKVLQLRLAKLREWGYLAPNQLKSGGVSWSRNGQEIGSISITVNTFSDNPFVELRYSYRGEPRKYRVRLISVRSNLGKGVVWFFCCPHTGKQCRILYHIGGFFLHREAFRDCLYESQTRSKHMRRVDRLYGACFNQEGLYQEPYGRYFKRYYKGKPTKRYARILQEMKKAERVSVVEFEQVLMTGKI